MTGRLYRTIFNFQLSISNFLRTIADAMTFIEEKNISSHEAILRELPLNSNLSEQVQQDREEIKNILSRKDARKLLIVGPCSAWPMDSVIEYAQKLKILAEELSPQFKIVMRVYTQKPRTGLGWTGPVSQPDPFREPDIEQGIHQCRKMMIDILQIGLPIAEEMVFPRKESYFRDLVSWLAVGARSSQNPEHRIIASGLDIPVGFKNATSGEIQTGVDSVQVAQHPQVFALEGKQWMTSGNPFSHLVLRGGVMGPNCDSASLALAEELLHQREIKNPAIIVDSNHGNCPEGASQQDILESLLPVLKNAKSAVIGLMIESFLKPGKHDPKTAQDVQQGRSITDSCLGWEETESILRKLSSNLPEFANFS